MDQKIITLNETEMEKPTFHQYKNSVLTYDVNMNENLVSTEVSFGKKNFKYFKDG